MNIKDNGKSCRIAEQIIDDPVTGLTFQFEVTPSGETRMRLFGDSLPYGNREYAFDLKGQEAGSGIAITGLCRPAWLEIID